MQTSSLTNISPVDGRYNTLTRRLSEYFSEHALFKYRVFIELKYLLFLSKIKIVRKLTKKEKSSVEDIYEKFSTHDSEKVKGYEAKTKHDVKAIEYFLRKRLKKDLLPWIHFGITSNDINDNAYRLMIVGSLKKVIGPEIDRLYTTLNSIAQKNLKLPMLARTHGQSAVPTTFGKEIAVFASRIKKEMSFLNRTELYGKFGGAVGNWNSLSLAYPKKNWKVLSTKFLKELGLKHSKITTQTAPPEDLISLFQTLYRINSVLLDLNQDIWRYISDSWVVQKGKNKDTGSSTMPQKINPIEFENSEGNLIIANALFESFARKLPISRLQRDLSDSTVLRNIGVAFSHSLLAYSSCIKGLESISPNKVKVLEDLNENWSILSEAIQTLMRKEGESDAYEIVALQIRGKKLTRTTWLNLVEETALSKHAKQKLLLLTPETYIGLSKKISN